MKILHFSGEIWHTGIKMTRERKERCVRNNFMHARFFLSPPHITPCAMPCNPTSIFLLQLMWMSVISDGNVNPIRHIYILGWEFRNNGRKRKERYDIMLHRIDNICKSLRENSWVTLPFHHLFYIEGLYSSIRLTPQVKKI